MSLAARTYAAMFVEFSVIGLILFLAAGTAAWVAGWTYFIIMFGGSVLLVRWLLKHSPGLLEERMVFSKPNQPAWDKIFVVVLSITYLAWLIIMPLDAVRFRWSNMLVLLQYAGVIIVTLSFVLFFLVFRENPYLSGAVRIQEERGQKVIDTGPYSYIRHPMYAAALLYFVGSGMLLGSWYGVLGGFILSLMLAARSVGEEKVLRDKLEGYDDYMEQVRYRIIPRIW